jgi:hypothetical protein
LTLTIINNTMKYRIYPVVTAGAKDITPTADNPASQWMQACFRVSFNNLATQRYPRDSQYRIYVNCCNTGENGIPPGGSVKITLPFYSPLVQTINPNPDTKNGIAAQFINWWQGGGINMFQALDSDGKPPTYLSDFWKADQANAVAPGDPNLGTKANPPTCSTAGCGLHFCRAPAGIDGWAPNQLIEYTMGAAGPDGNAGAAKPTAPNFVWDPTNIDYDVSNVNNTYMPAALEIDGNALVGTCCAIAGSARQWRLKLSLRISPTGAAQLLGTAGQPTSTKTTSPTPWPARSRRLSRYLTTPAVSTTPTPTARRPQQRRRSCA